MTSQRSTNEPDPHELLGEPQTVLHENEPYLDPQLEEIQRITAGGPPRKADYAAMPKPIRLFGYFFSAAVVVMALFSLYFILFHRSGQ